MVETEPHRVGGRFRGFRILRFVHGEPSALDLRTGDVVCAINGKSIASPDDFFAAYQALQSAAELRFDLIRNGDTVTLAYPIK